MENAYNARCPAVKRLFREAAELHEATEEYYAHPLEDNLFEWHFTVRGPPETDFDGGIYHGRIVMPAEYPMKPPNIIFFTPNGRFETNKKIRLSISGFHPETWQPSWSIRTALLAIIGFMPSSGAGTIGGLDYNSSERKKLAEKSCNFKCDICGSISSLLKERTSKNDDLQKEAKEVSKLVAVTTKENKPEPREYNSPTFNGADASSRVENVETSEVGERTEVSQNVSSTEARNSLDANISDIGNDSSNISTNNTGSIGANTQIHSTTLISPLMNNFLIASAVCVIAALILRRLFLLDYGGEEPEALLL